MSDSHSSALTGRIEAAPGSASPADPIAPSRDLSSEFKLAMRAMACTVYVVTLEYEGQRHGLTATAVSSLSLEPPSILICVNRSASIHEHLLSADRFCLNALSADQRDVATAFGTSGLGEERFRTGIWQDLAGLPALEKAVASIVCRRVEARAFASHTILIGEVEAVRCDADEAPLVYCQGAFR